MGMSETNMLLEPNKNNWISEKQYEDLIALKIMQEIELIKSQKTLNNILENIKPKNINGGL